MITLTRPQQLLAGLALAALISYVAVALGVHAAAAAAARRALCRARALGAHS